MTLLNAQTNLSLVVVLLVLVFAFFPGISTLRSPSQQELIPLTAGTYWIYKRTDRECAGEGLVDEISMVHKLTVVDTLLQDRTKVALVEDRNLLEHLRRKRINDRGTVLEQHDESKHSPAVYTISLVFDSKRYYELILDPSSETPEQKPLGAWEALKKEVVAGHRIAEPDESELVMKLPADIGSSWAGPEGRADGWYSWRVEKIAKVQEAAGNIAQFSLPAGTTEYSLAYRSCPGHELRDFVPGIGVTSFEYHHHGTLSEISDRLLEFHSGTPE
jgi:hypothetical protein